MEFARLLEIVGDAPVFESALLYAGVANVADVQRQLSRWVRQGRIHALRRGVYTLAAPYQKTQPHPFLVANYMTPASYVSCEAALGFHGLIPEWSSSITSITTHRPSVWHNACGTFIAHNIKVAYWFGYSQVSLDRRQSAFVATPEKALLDLIHLHPGVDLGAFVDGLRLQQLDRIDLGRLNDFAQRAGKPRWRMAAQCIAQRAADWAGEFVELA